MIRVNVVAEGQSEMKFAKCSLNKYFGGSPLVSSRCVMTSKDSKTNYEYRGGLLKYQHAKRDILRWGKEDIASEMYSQGIACRFIPYIQLHEFETLLFTDIKVLEYDYLEPEDIAKIHQLYEETRAIPPEEINHGAQTAPSKRLLRALNYKKGETVSELLEVIGIHRIRQKCPHFSEWIHTLQRLPKLQDLEL